MADKKISELTNLTATATGDLVPLVDVSTSETKHTTRANLFGQDLTEADSPTFAGLTVDTSTLYVDSANNRVGIGTSSPASRLHVDGTARISGFLRAESTIYRYNLTDGDTGILAVFDSSGANVGQLAALNFDGAGGSTDWVFQGTVNNIRFQNAGNVGIGTNNPSEKLSVSGNISVTGTVDGRDVAADGTKLDTLWSFGFDSRSSLVTYWSGLSASEKSDVPDGAVWTDGTVSYVRDAGATDISDMSGWVPFGDVYPDHFAENATPGTTDMTTAVQAAIDYVSDVFGGGVVRFTYDRYAISSTINHKRAVYLRGEGYFFNNDYVASTDTLTGSCLFVLAGSNCDALLVRADVSDLSGSSFPRQYGGIENMAIHGNKSQSNSRTATDLNSAGNGVLIQGVSYFDMEDVLTYRCAENGVATESYDYGDGNGARSCNNLHWNDIRSIHNAENGFSVFAGDSHFSQIVGGYNGLDGWNGNGQPFSTALFWNNGRRGISVSSSNDGAGLRGVRAYDNAHSGIYLSSGDYHQLIGCASFDNGQEETGVAAEEAGVVIAGTADKITIVGCEIAPHGDTTQLRGIYSTITGLDLTLGSNRISGHATADLSLSDFSGVKLHGDIGSNAATHPGFTLTSDILQGGNVVYDAGASSVTINTAGTNLFDAGTNGAMWLVVVAHIGGAQAGHAFVLGDATTPLIISQDTGGGQTVTFSVSSTTIRATAGTSNFTGSWRAMRLV